MLNDLPKTKERHSGKLALTLPFRPALTLPLTFSPFRQDFSSVVLYLSPLVLRWSPWSQTLTPGRCSSPGPAPPSHPWGPSRIHSQTPVTSFSLLCSSVTTLLCLFWDLLAGSFSSPLNECPLCLWLTIFQRPQLWYPIPHPLSSLWENTCKPVPFPTDLRRGIWVYTLSSDLLLQLQLMDTQPPTDCSPLSVKEPSGTQNWGLHFCCYPQVLNLVSALASLHWFGILFLQGSTGIVFSTLGFWENIASTERPSPMALHKMTSPHLCRNTHLYFIFFFFFFAWPLTMPGLKLFLYFLSLPLGSSSKRARLFFWLVAFRVSVNDQTQDKPQCGKPRSNEFQKNQVLWLKTLISLAAIVLDLESRQIGRWIDH